MSINDEKRTTTKRAQVQMDREREREGAAAGGDDSMAAIKHTHPWADESGLPPG